MQSVSGSLFEHACAKAVMSHFSPDVKLHNHWVKNCPTYAKHAKLFAAQSASVRTKLLLQAKRLIDTLVHTDEFIKKGYTLPQSVFMLGSDQGQKGNTTDIEMHFMDGQRLNISCKHKSVENKTPRLCHNRKNKHLWIKALDFLGDHPDDHWSSIDALVLGWLKEHQGKVFDSMNAEKWCYYDLIVNTLAHDLWNHWKPYSKGQGKTLSFYHDLTQKQQVMQLLQFWIGTHSYFLVRKVNEYEGELQKVDVQSYCKRIMNDQVYVKNIYAYTSVQNDPSAPVQDTPLHNYVCIEFSDGFAMHVRIKNGDTKIKPSSMKFSVQLQNAQLLSKQYSVLFYSTSKT